MTEQEAQNIVHNAAALVRYGTAPAIVAAVRLMQSVATSGHLLASIGYTHEAVEVLRAVRPYAIGETLPYYNRPVRGRPLMACSNVVFMLNLHRVHGLPIRREP